MPLADRNRPRSFDDMVGQKDLIGPDGILRRMADAKTLQSVIFYGPPGTGKTTAALILADAVDKPLHKLNAVSASTSDIKAIAKDAPPEGVVLYLDEIQYFNKKQQQSLLPYIESGAITLIASTTENPYHDVYDAILSRCAVLEFKPVPAEDVYHRLVNAVSGDDDGLGSICTDVLMFVAQISSGDLRRAFNTLELIASRFADGLSDVTVDDVRALLPSAQTAGFDKDGDSHYKYVSALQKSIRGSDPDAAVFWLAKLLEGGDIISPSRRLMVIACEDVGLAAPGAVQHTYACMQAAHMLGLPEAYYPLTQAVVMLALAPKSNSIGKAFDAARQDIREGRGTVVPWHLTSERHPAYVYPHDCPDHWADQQYLPDDLLMRRYYEPGDNPTERGAYDYWAYIRNKNR